MEIHQHLRNLISPICFFAIAFYIHPQLADNTFFNSQLVSYIPLFILGLSLLLSWKFARFNSFYLSLICAIIYTALLVFTPIEAQDKTQYEIIISAAFIFLPLNFILFKIFSVSSIFSIANLNRLIIIIVEILLVYWILESNNLLAQQILTTHTLAEFKLSPGYLPLYGAALFAAAFIIQIFMSVIRPGILQSNQLIIIMVLAGTFVLIDSPQLPWFIFLTVGVALSVAIIQESYELAYVDTLTQLPGRRSMEEELKKLGKHYAIAMLDIDHFKKLNDKHGHDVGDQVLKMVAKFIRRVGGNGKPARYGGEEFAIIFPGRTVADVTPHLQEIRENIANNDFAIRSKDRPKKIPKNKIPKKEPAKLISVTISIGVAARSETNTNPGSVMKAADKALYKAKRYGRNKVCY